MYEELADEIGRFRECPVVETYPLGRWARRARREVASSARKLSLMRPCRVHRLTNTDMGVAMKITSAVFLLFTVCITPAAAEKDCAETKRSINH